jgi:ADP-ribose pyrophosphatase
MTGLEPDESRVVYDGRLIGVTLERWADREREIVEHPGAVAIVAVDREDRVWLVRQLREAVRRNLVELPAGTREPGEEPLATARRELREECGLTGGRWRELAFFWTTPGFTREGMHLYLAEDVDEGESSPEDDEEFEIQHWQAGEIAARLGEVEDAKTLAGLLLYLRVRSGS